VHVSVTDAGPRIALEDQERVYGEFQQTDLGVQQREGTGLGLTLCMPAVTVISCGG
jgi:K+-sensing histidine kinase KdpD